MSAMRELFVYYRVRPEHLGQARAAVSTMQSELRLRFPGLQARLLRRPQASDGCQTWMETYACEPQGVTAEIGAAIEAGSAWAAALVDGARHVEEFVPGVS